MKYKGNVMEMSIEKIAAEKVFKSLNESEKGVLRGGGINSMIIQLVSECRGSRVKIYKALMMLAERDAIINLPVDKIVEAGVTDSSK